MAEQQRVIVFTHLTQILTFGDPFCSNFDLWGEQGLQKVCCVDSQQV